jgi:hypothetical protein
MNEPTAAGMFFLYGYFHIGLDTSRIEHLERDEMSFGLYLLITLLWPVYWALKGIKYLWRKLC